MWSTFLFQNIAYRTGRYSNNFRFHDLRHGCASILCANGVDILTIQKILGHAQLSTTYMYTHIIDDQQNTALVQMGQQIMGGDENGER